MTNLKHYRERSGLSRSELALAVGLKTGGAIEHYEADRRRAPLQTARKIIAALNAEGIHCSLDDVFPPVKTRKRTAA